MDPMDPKLVLYEKVIKYEAFEIWPWRIIGQINQTQKMHNEEVLNRVANTINTGNND